MEKKLQEIPDAGYAAIIEPQVSLLDNKRTARIALYMFANQGFNPSKVKKRVGGPIDIVIDVLHKWACLPKPLTNDKLIEKIEKRMEQIPYKGTTFKNGMMMVFDETGEQIPRYQGRRKKGLRRLEKDGYKLIKCEGNLYCCDFKIVKNED